MQDEEEAVKVLAGLGNPGSRYGGSRHNAGFWVVDCLAKRWNISCSQKKFHSLVGETRAAGEKVLLVKPQTFMNRSGQGVAAAAEFFGVEGEDILVVVDDLDLPPGAIRLRPKGSAGGHNGIKDVIRHLGHQEFPRLRVGIGSAPERVDPADYVLTRPTDDERKLLDEAVERAADAAETWIESGIQRAMALYNRKLHNGALPE